MVVRSFRDTMYSIKSNHRKMFTNIIAEVQHYLSNHRELKSLIVGISGGIDSALTMALAHEALKEVEDVSLIGRSIPIETNTAGEISRSEKVGAAFADDFAVKDLKKIYRTLYQDLDPDNDRQASSGRQEKVRRGNIKARLRMIYLFDLAHMNEGMVLSTDNYTELLLGYWTLHGDVGNYGMLQNLWKTEVYGLAQYMVENYVKEGESEKGEALRECIEAVPTDGLGITGSDFEQIGVADYEAADKIFIEYLSGSKEYDDHPLIKRHLASEFKRLDPQNIKRDAIFNS